MYSCMHVCVANYVVIQANVRMHACMHTYTVFMHACMCVCVCVYIYVHVVHVCNIYCYYPTRGKERSEKKSANMYVCMCACMRKHMDRRALCEE